MITAKHKILIVSLVMVAAIIVVLVVSAFGGIGYDRMFRRLMSILSFTVM